ncbi:9495_t:CDS:1, partial [Ambispora leptoticha]
MTIINLGELCEIFSTIVDPGEQDEYLVEEIQKWRVTNNYTEQEVFEALVVRAKASLKKHDQQPQIYACVLGLFYHYRIGTHSNKKKSFKWYAISACFGNPFGMNQLGWCYSIPFGTDRDYEKAIYWIKESAHLGNSSGACNLAYAYRLGIMIERNNVKSYLWYEYAANAGVLHAQMNMACYHRIGLGTSKDVHEAFKWYRKASKHPKSTRKM